MPEPAEVAAFRTLLTVEGRELLAAISPYDEQRALNTADALRRQGVDPALAAAAMTQARLRARAAEKFGPAADRMWFTPDGLEQATRPSVAELHARRFTPVRPERLADLCCGIGGDLVPLRNAAERVLGVDRDPLTAVVAAANAAALAPDSRVEVRCADVTTVPLDGISGVFIDPARRSGGARRLDPRTWSPPLSFVLEVAARVPATGAKIAPGVPHDALPERAEAEWVSVDGDVVECGLWFGPLSTGVRRRATLLPGRASLTGDGSRRAEPGPVGRYLLEPDGAVIRAGLVAELADLVGGRLLDSTIAYLTTDAVPETPFGTWYEITDVLPFGVKRLRALLRERRVGRLIVKKRGTAVDPEALRRSLRLSGDAEATVVLTRVAGEHTALLVRPIGQPLRTGQSADGAATT